MKLSETVDVFKQVVVRCPKLEGNNFLIMIPQPTEPIISTGYEIIIRKSKRLDDKTDEALRAIALENHLKIMETENTIALYTPTDEIE